MTIFTSCSACLVIALFFVGFGEAAGNIGGAERAVVVPLKARQAISSASASSTSVVESSASLTVASDSASASSTASDSSITTSPPITSATTASEDNQADEIASTEPNGNVILSIITPPPYTATSLTAYNAPPVNTTTNPPPPITLPTTPASSSSSSSSTSSISSTSVYVAPGAWATARGVPGNILTKCQIDGKNDTWGPFCSPNSLQTLWVGYTYAMTWNGDLFPLNATSTVQLQYNDTALGNATITGSTPSYFGYQNITMDEAWLRGADGNSSWSGQNITLIMISQPAGGGPAIVKPGPMISLARNPKTLPPVMIPKIPSKYGLEIGLPIGLVALIIIILSVCCACRKNNGRFRDLQTSVTKDYMSKRARRGGGGRRGGGKGGDWDADDLELSTADGHGGYTDEPVKGGQNAFRDEIQRQREEDDRSMKRTYSSY